MNDDAKFFFFMSGFAGFLVFYTLSSLIHGDLIHGLLHASIGCFLFSITGRFLLGFALSSSSANSKDVDYKGNFSGNVPAVGNRKISGEELAASTNLEALKNAKAVSLPKS